MKKKISILVYISLFAIMTLSLTACKDYKPWEIDTLVAISVTQDGETKNLAGDTWHITSKEKPSFDECVALRLLKGNNFYLRLYEKEITGTYTYRYTDFLGNRIKFTLSLPDGEKANGESTKSMFDGIWYTAILTVGNAEFNLKNTEQSPEKYMTHAEWETFLQERYGNEINKLKASKKEKSGNYYYGKIVEDDYNRFIFTSKYGTRYLNKDCDGQIPFYLVYSDGRVEYTDIMVNTDCYILEDFWHRYEDGELKTYTDYAFFFLK